MRWRPDGGGGPVREERRREHGSWQSGAGWQRVWAVERHTSMQDPRSTVVSSEGPLLVFPLRGGEWPTGEINLRGTPW